MGKPKHSNDPRGEQKGAQQYAEGQYGPKAFEAKWNEITDHSGSRGESPRAAGDPRGGGAPGEAEVHERLMENPEFNRDGGRRLFENRKQHDEAEKNSEKNRRSIDVERHGHDRSRFQLEGGRAGHPAGPEHGDPPIRSGGQGGSNV